MQGLAQVQKRVAQYASRTVDGVPMYPGEYVGTWVKIGVMSCQLLSIARFS